MQSFLNVKECGTYNYHFILKVLFPPVEIDTGNILTAISDVFHTTLITLPTDTPCEDGSRNTDLL
jgi:hypothetical protein